MLRDCGYRAELILTLDADALVKCFAMSISTGLLLIIMGTFFDTVLNFLVVPGTMVTFIATWLYFEKATSKPAPTNPGAPPDGASKWQGPLAKLSRRVCFVSPLFTYA